MELLSSLAALPAFSLAGAAIAGHRFNSSAKLDPHLSWWMTLLAHQLNVLAACVILACAGRRMIRSAPLDRLTGRRRR
jgi:hypothetical protein